MLNVIRSPLHASHLSFQFEEVDHFPKRSSAKYERGCSCFFQKNLRVEREKERIKQFSIWYAEVDKYKQEDYIKRRRKWRTERKERVQKLWKIHALLVPVALLLLPGVFLLVACHLEFHHLGDWFKENKPELIVVGSICVASSVVLFMIEQGLLSYYGNKTGIKMFIQFRKTGKNAFVLRKSGTDYSQTKYISKTSSHSTIKKEQTEYVRVDSTDTTDSEDTNGALNESDPILKTIQSQSKRRPPKLSEIAVGENGAHILDSVDTATSALTEFTLISSSDRSSTSEISAPFRESEHSDGSRIVMKDDDMETMTLQSSDSADFLLS